MLHGSKSKHPCSSADKEWTLMTTTTATTTKTTITFSIGLEVLHNLIKSLRVGELLPEVRKI